MQDASRRRFQAGMPLHHCDAAQEPAATCRQAVVAERARIRSEGSEICVAVELPSLVQNREKRCEICRPRPS